MDRPQRVLFLGAGSSVGAGYPLGRDLIRAVEEFFATIEMDVGRKAYWERFLSFRDTAKDTAQLLLHSGNPEVVLSYLDLCVEGLLADDAEIRAAERSAVHDFLRIQDGGEATEFARDREVDIEALYNDLKRAPFKAAARARLGFVAGLDAYLGYMHAADDQAGAAKRRDYLYRELGNLDEGDIVITTNYDTLAERALLETGRLSAIDGYGFTVPLTSVPSDAIVPRRDPPTWATRPSKVKVLKLHGSFGWRQIEGLSDTASDEVILGSELLQFMLPAKGGRTSLLYDRREKRAPFPMTVPAMAYPSYLKQTTGSTLLDVWEATRLALEHATEIRILGASLPPADTAVRTLFLATRSRLQRAEVSVQVDDRSEESFNRWRTHLGPRVQWAKRFAGE
ncbi:MAG: SIR2 family protein [Gemmatimonadaceae bacterium]